jgi:hypothetical protein
VAPDAARGDFVGVEPTNVVNFGLQKLLEDSLSIELFLLGTNTSGFLVIGLVAHPSDTFVWSLLEADFNSNAG